MVKDFFTDYEKYFNIIDIYPGHTFGHRCNQLYTLFMVKSKADSDNFQPCTIEISPKTQLKTSTSTTEQTIVITDELCKERDWNLKQVNHMVAE